jgi:hypothetical protein
LDTSEEDDIEIYNNNHDSVDGISKPLDALEYQIQIHESAHNRNAIFFNGNFFSYNN